MSQVSLTDPDQAALVKMSTHFNPVFMVCDKTDLQGKQLDLTQYKNDLLYLKVVKTDNGRTVRYRELPGLWNGSMHNWITIFVELPAEVFTPVKTIVDLI